MNQKEYTAKLEAISTLEKGWNGYKADPPNPKVIEDAYAFLKLLPEPDSVCLFYQEVLQGLRAHSRPLPCALVQ